ncbi:hypothetical protein Pcac1_g1837 [Phytophthora cactorum]|nr:hypothetical protein Pcac1_g1837 [Phytophthora cactorum]KAG2795761.1 hypothetical protein PC111_g22009 [Phytophthora cactorum]KAG2823021.1 hypothetical protein PC113_g22245 [Phytophthora cactorum]KAG3043054.1 hypothetical protein PC121_g22782 [Phytophthora cactorum]
MINNALWGFVQPIGGWKQYAGRMHEAELQSLAKRRETDDASLEATTNRAAIRTSLPIDKPSEKRFPLFSHIVAHVQFQ